MRSPLAGLKARRIGIVCYQIEVKSPHVEHYLQGIKQPGRRIEFSELTDRAASLVVTRVCRPSSDLDN